MKWTIFSRLMAGYLALLALATAVSAYAIIQLRHVRDVTGSVILVDNRLLDLHKGLSDALLSQQRYEKKYIIMRDEVLYRGFQKSNEEFEQQLREAAGVAKTADLKAALSQAGALHLSYQALFGDEAHFLRSGSVYDAARYRDEKERTITALGDSLAKLRSLSQRSMFDKVKQLGEAGTRATRAAMFTTGTAVAAGIILAVFITRSITRPLAEMKKKMAELSGGLHEGNLNISSPPEIAALARSFNFMCLKLKELDKLKANFYALMSHELRTPLASIKESTSLFLEGRGGAVTEKQKKLLTIIAEESNRLIELVNSLLDISKLEAGMAVYSFCSAELNPLIAKAVYEVTPLAEAKGISIEKRLSELPALTLDAERMLQVLRNLIGNALKFTPRYGRISISSSKTERGVAVSVSDTGPGISSEQAAVIFEKYRQAAGSGSRTLQGTGLGLAIVKHIVDSHGGTVWAESGGGQGSTFTFVLPVS